jgi:hypothetical protein
MQKWTQRGRAAAKTAKYAKYAEYHARTGRRYPPHLSQIAAAYGAVAASRQRLSPDQLSQAELHLRKAMQSSAGSAALREKVADAARQKTCRLLVCAPSMPAVPAGQVPVSAVLELAVE